MPRPLSPLAIGLVTALALTGVSGASAFTGGSNTQVTVGGGYDDPSIGTLALRWSQAPYPSYRMSFSTRGSVRLDPGSWCIVTSLLPQTSRRVARRKQVRLLDSATVPLPRFTGRRVGRVVWGDTVAVEAVRVRVLEGGCAGREYARGQIFLGGGE